MRKSLAKTIGVAHSSSPCDGSAVTGIDRDAAARDLYGTGSTQYNTVAAAWSAVAVS